jgi:polyribonucleotide nucleotidyltransferase
LILELTYPENTRIDIIISTHSNNDKNQFLDNWKDARCKLQLKRTITSYRRARSDLLRSVNMTLEEASEFIESKLISSIEKSKKASENIRLINKEVTEEFKSKSQSLTEELAELEKLCSDVKQKIRINDMNMRSEFERRAVPFKKQLFHENTVNKILNEEFPIDHDKCSENSLHPA